MRKYVILKLSDVTQEMIDNCMETSFDTLRVSKNGNTILKWEGNKPTCLYGIKDYTYSKIKEKLKKAEWNDEDI